MAAAVAMDARIFKIFTVFLPNMADKTAKNPIPSTPPSVFPIRSVISLAPMANTNCMVSYKRLTPAMGRTFLQKSGLFVQHGHVQAKWNKGKNIQDNFGYICFPVYNRRACKRNQIDVSQLHAKEHCKIGAHLE